MEITLSIMIGATLLYALGVWGFARMLSKKPRPYPTKWSAVYLRRVARFRQSILTSLLIVAPNTIIFLIPILLRVGDQRSAALSGGLDVLCSLVLYLLWKWTGRLLFTAASYAASHG